MQNIIDAAQALAGLLRAAEDSGIPLPYDASVNNYPPHRHPTVDFGAGVNLIVHPSDLNAWAAWLDAELIANDEPYKGAVHTHAYGMVGPVPVGVTALIPVAEQVSS